MPQTNGFCQSIFLEVAGDGESEIRLLHEASDFGEPLIPEFAGATARRPA